MKISTKGRYATRFMLELALRPLGQPLTIKEAALSQQISEKYLEQLIPPLRKQGFIRSVRGAQGGYLLNQEPQSITVGMLLRALEGPLAPVDCVLALDPGTFPTAKQCNNMSRCVTVDVWKEIYDAVNQVVDRISLADLVERHKEKGNISDSTNPYKCGMI